MKRRIEPEQLKELTEEQQQNLRESWKPEKGDIVLRNSDGWEWVIDFIGDAFSDDMPVSLEFTLGEVLMPKSECPPLFDIGQMIELLESKDQCLNIVKRTDLKGWGYEIQLRHLKYYKFETGELCDALWQAVKAVL